MLKYRYIVIIGVIVALIGVFAVNRGYCGDLWKITAYCSCEKCCGKSDGIMASGKKVYIGAIACNVLPIGTSIVIPDTKDIKLNTFTAFTYKVEDRGSHKLFDKQKHIDIYLPDHEWAKRFGVQYSRVYKIELKQI